MFNRNFDGCQSKDLIILNRARYQSMNFSGVLLCAIIAMLLSLHGDIWYIISGEPSVKGKTVIVTGASQGIGSALVKEYALKGAGDIVMASRSVDKMEAIRDGIYATGVDPANTRIHVLKADLSTKEASEQCISDALKIFGNKGLDFLVLNHITNSRFGSWLVDNKALPGGHNFVNEMFATNVYSYVYMATAAIEALKKNSGQLVVISSLAGWVGPPKIAVYAATKHALNGFFDSLRIELNLLGIKNVGITIANLGAHDTEGAQEVKNQIHTPLLNWEPPGDAARVVVRGAAARRRELFYPFSVVYPMVALRPFFPALCDWLISLPYH